MCISDDKDNQINPSLVKKANDLVGFAQCVATGMSDFYERFPVLSQVKLDRWEYILTIAGVFMAATRLNNLDICDQYEEKLMEIVSVHLSNWDADAIDGFEDCKEFYETTYDLLVVKNHDFNYVASDALGFWIIWNMLEHSPETDEERQLVRTVGAMVIHAFHDWWNIS